MRCLFLVVTFIMLASFSYAQDKTSTAVLITCPAQNEFSILKLSVDSVTNKDDLKFGRIDGGNKDINWMLANECKFGTTDSGYGLDTDTEITIRPTDAGKYAVNSFSIVHGMIIGGRYIYDTYSYDMVDCTIIK